MFEEIRIIFSDFGKTYSSLTSMLRNSSKKAPNFLFGWFKSITSKLLSISLLAVATLVVVAATQFFALLAINLFLTGQIVPALFSLVPMAFCAAACVPIFNQLLRVTGFAERARKLVQAGKTMEFFGRAKIPSRKTIAEKNALSAEVDNPQFQIRITPPLPTRWIDISYLVAPSDFWAIPEYIRYAANWIVKKSGLLNYAASLDSSSARAEFRADTEFVTDANPSLRPQTDIEIAKSQVQRFVEMTGRGYSKENIKGETVKVDGLNFAIANHIKSKVEPNAPEFKTYYKFLIQNPANSLYLKWHQDKILPLAQEFNKSNNALIEFRQAQMRFEEQRQSSLSEFITKEVTAASKLSAIDAFKQILSIPAKYLSTKYASIASEMQNNLKHIIKELEQAEKRYNAAIASAEKEFIAEFDAKYEAFKASQSNKGSANDNIIALPSILLLNDKIGVHVDNTPRVLSAKEIEEINVVEAKIGAFNAEQQNLNSETTKLTEELQQKELEIEELKNKILQHSNSSYHKHAMEDVALTSEVWQEVSGDEILTKFYTAKKELYDMSSKHQELSRDLEASKAMQNKELEKLEKYRSENQNILHDLEVIQSSVNAQINSGINFLLNNYSYIIKDKNVEKILNDARKDLNIQETEKHLQEVVKRLNIAMLELQQATSDDARRVANQQVREVESEFNAVKLALQQKYAALPAKLYELVVQQDAEFRKYSKQEDMQPALLTSFELKRKQEIQNKNIIQQQVNKVLAAIDDIRAINGSIPIEIASRIAQPMVVPNVPGLDPNATDDMEADKPKSPNNHSKKLMHRN